MGLKSCTVCQDSYPEKPGDIGICRLCEIRERGWRNKIANEVQALGANTFIVESIKREHGRYEVRSLREALA